MRSVVVLLCCLSLATAQANPASADWAPDYSPSAESLDDAAGQPPVAIAIPDVEDGLAPGWQRLALEAADVNDLVETSDGVLLAATYTGVFRSVDGVRWENASTGLPTATAIALVRAADGRLYVSVFTRGLYVSTNQGATWAATGIGNGRIITCLDAAPGGALYAGTADGAVLRSLDGGESWQEHVIPFPTAVLKVLGLDGSVVIAGTLGRGVLRSEDHGVIWTQVNAGNPVVRSLHRLSDGRVLAGSESAPALGGALSISGDQGLTWQSLASPCAGSAVGLTARGDVVFAACPDGGVLSSNDGGQSWQTLANGLGWTFGLHSIITSGIGDLLLATAAHGVRRSADGGASWSTMNTGLSGYKVEAIRMDDAGRLFVATSASGLFRSLDRGATWHPANQGLQFPQVLSLECDHVTDALYAGTGNGGIVRTSDGGVSWQSIGGGFPGAVPVEALYIDASSTLWAGKSSGGGLWRLSSDGSWGPANCGLPDQSIRALAPNGTGEPVAGTNSLGVFRFSAGSECWLDYNLGFAGAPGTIESMARSPSTGTLVATTFQGVYRVPASDSLWAGTGLKVPYVRSLDVNATGVMYAGAGYFNVDRRNDVLTSEDDGVTWVSIRGDLPTLEPVNAICAAEDELFVGTWNGGLFVRRSAAVGVPVPRPAALSARSSPNPFRTGTRIALRLPRPGVVTLRIYSVDGRCIRTLTAAAPTAGEVAIAWDGQDEGGRDLPSGLYFGRFEQLGDTGTIRLVRAR